MAHVFKKYTTNRGSALFMVLSTMTALLISCMAMYFTMVSARSTQFAVFDQQQAHQTAQSVAEIVYSNINDADNVAGTKLREKMQALNIGESITTGANSFASLDPNNSAITGKDLDQLGGYSVIITRTNDKSGVKQFDINVLSTVSDTRDSVHLIVSYIFHDSPDGGGKGDEDLFAATGYVPNDAYIDGGYYLSDLFYDTQYTYMNTFDTGAGENRIAYDLYTSGDLEIGPNAMTVVHSHNSGAIKDEDVNKIGPVTWAIAGNFTAGFTSDFGIRGGSNIFVGGDLNVTNGNNFFYVKNDGYTGTKIDHICTYVMGDLDYGNAKLKPNNWLFVNGKVKGITGFDTNAKLFVTNLDNVDDSIRSSAQLWSGSIPSDCLTLEDSKNQIENLTQPNEYYKWDVSSLTDGPETQTLDIKLNPHRDAWNGLDAKQNTFLISYDENTDTASHIISQGGTELGAIGKSFIVNSIEINPNADCNTSRNIIIDTGEDPNNIMVFKLKANYNGNTTFMWFPESDPFSQVNPGGRNLLIKGRGTVIFDIPEGVIYQDATDQFTGHIGWWQILGGNEDTSGAHLNYSGRDVQDNQASSKILPYIHTHCADGDGCIYTTSDAKKEDGSPIKCAQCNTIKKTVTCGTHGEVCTYCPNPECETDINLKNKTSGFCANRVDTDALDTFFNANPSKKLTDSSGKTIYPTTNIMFVSNDESADMRFALSKDNKVIQHNTVFGFIYAPYMTFQASGNGQKNGAGIIQLCGGMTVSDYDISAINSYIACYPDKTPNQLADLGVGSKEPINGGSKSWKYKLNGYK